MCERPAIVIVGAGIAGLTAALAIADAGFRVIVAERSAELLEIGAGIQLSPNAGRVLAGEVGTHGWVQTVEEREPGVASVSAPVRRGDVVLAAISASGPIDRTGRAPGRRHGDAVTAAARAVERSL